MSHYTQHLDHCLTETLIPADLHKQLDVRGQEILKEFQSDAHPMLKALKNLLTREDDLPEIDEFIHHIQARAKHLVVMGMGGSCLGGRMLCDLQDTPAISVHFIENIDPHTIEQLLASLDMAQSFFLAISKSGSTVETLAQTLICFDRLKATCGEGALTSQAAIITEPKDSPLTQLANRYRIPTLPHPQEIGGRFSVLTAVGLVPAGVTGVEIRTLRQGAQSVVDQLNQAQTPWDVAPIAGAAAAYGLLQQGYSQSVMMPYCDRLAKLSAWYCQLWAESLGKDGKGQTPVRSIGAVDQHSQLQLFLDGPKDKLITLIMLNQHGKGPTLPTELSGDIRLDYLQGHTLGDLMAAEQSATAETLAARGRPVRHFILEQLGVAEVGALLMHFMLETIAMAAFMGVNAFDQPAVEEGKRLTRAYLAQKRAA